MKSVLSIVSFAVVKTNHSLAPLRKAIEHVTETNIYQCLIMGTQCNVQDLLFEIVKVGIQGKIGRVITCVPW